MLDSALRLSLDIVFPPPAHYPNTAKHEAPNNALEMTRFELVYDERADIGKVGEFMCGRMEGSEKEAENELFDSDSEGVDYELD